METTLCPSHISESACLADSETALTNKYEHYECSSINQPNPHNKLDSVEFNLSRIHGEALSPNTSENSSLKDVIQPKKSLVYDYPLPPGFVLPSRRDPRLNLLSQSEPTSNITPSYIDNCL